MYLLYTIIITVYELIFKFRGAFWEWSGMIYLLGKPRKQTAAPPCLCLPCLYSRWVVPWPSPQGCLAFRPLTEERKLPWGNMKHYRLNEILSEHSKALFISTGSGEKSSRKMFKTGCLIQQHRKSIVAHGVFLFFTRERKHFKRGPAW